MTRYLTLLQNPPATIPPTAEVIITYSVPGVGEVYISEQPPLLVSGGTTGLRTWEASLLLSEWLLEQDLRGKNILELGSGTGLTGILAAKKGANVTVTDGSETVVTKLRSNFQLNNVDGEIRSLWWGEQDEILERRWDLVLGADIAYDKDVCSNLAQTYALALRHGGTGILAVTVRNVDTVNAFLRESGTAFSIPFLR